MKRNSIEYFKCSKSSYTKFLRLEKVFSVNCICILGSAQERINMECWEVLLGKCFHSNDLGSDAEYSDVATLLSLEEVNTFSG